MQLARRFSRWKGGGAPSGAKVLGGDTVPTDAPNVPPLDHVLVTRTAGMRGFPLRSIAVAYHPPSGSLALMATVYVFDELTSRWLRIGAAWQSIDADAVSVLTVPSISEWLHGSVDESAQPSAAFAIVIADPGTAPNGEHVFAVGAVV